jgi:hypothetical protein
MLTDKVILISTEDSPRASVIDLLPAAMNLLTLNLNDNLPDDGKMHRVTFTWAIEPIEPL